MALILPQKKKMQFSGLILRSLANSALDLNEFAVHYRKFYVCVLDVTRH